MCLSQWKLWQPYARQPPLEGPPSPGSSWLLPLAGMFIYSTKSDAALAMCQTLFQALDKYSLRYIIKTL